MSARVTPSFLTGMFLAASLSPLGSTMIAVALPSIGTELGVGGGELTQWLVASYLIVGIAAMSPCGKLGDRMGHGRGLLVGMAIYGTGSAIGFALATLPALAFARISMALGGAMVVPATMAMLRNMVAPERRGRMFGLMGSVMGTAAATGPLIGGELTARFGWRSVFIANIPVILLSWFLIRRGTAAARSAVAAEPPPSGSERRPAPFDIPGSVLLGLGLSLLVITSRASGVVAISTAVAAVALLLVFGWWERRVPEPVLDLTLFLRPAFTAASLIVAMQNLAMYALLFQLPIFFEKVRHVNAGHTGRTIIGMMIAMVVFSPVGGRLTERIGSRATAVAGSLVSLGGLYLLSDFARLQTPHDALAGLVLMGTGLGLSTAPSQSAAMAAVSRVNAGMGGGAISTMRYIGGMIGISALGVLLNGPHAGVEEHGSTIFVYAAALVLSLAAALVLPSRVSMTD